MAVSDDALEAALLLISDGQSLRFAARELEIPVTSLYVALAARVAIDALKWTAGKRSPRKFGDKLSLAGEPGAPAAISVQVELVRSGARQDS